MAARWRARLAQGLWGGQGLRERGRAVVVTQNKEDVLNVAELELFDYRGGCGAASALCMA